MKVVIASGYPLHKTPRVVKWARACEAAGHQVTVLAGRFSAEDPDVLKAEGSSIKVVHVVDAAGSSTARGHWQWCRLRRFIWVRFYRWFSLQNVRQLGYAAPELRARCRSIRADIYLLHLEAALWLAADLVGEKARFAVDFEDWFSEDLLPEARRDRPIALLKQLEAYAVRHAAVVTAASEAMALALEVAYERKGIVAIHNCFGGAGAENPLRPSQVELAHRPEERPVRIVWISQTIGPGRGLELLLDAVAQTGGRFSVHLFGHATESFARSLKDLVRGQFSLEQCGTIPADRIPATLAQFDVGYIGDALTSRSRDLTVTNKLFHYLDAGLPVIAAATTGHQKIAATLDGAVTLFDLNREASLVEALDQHRSLSRRQAASRAAWAASLTIGSWQSESQKLIQALGLSKAPPAETTDL